LSIDHVEENKVSDSPTPSTHGADGNAEAMTDVISFLGIIIKATFQVRMEGTTRPVRTITARALLVRSWEKAPRRLIALKASQPISLI
jgi:hypothetical protein